MPRQEITPENKVGAEEKFPKVEFKNEGEKQRIWCGEHNPQTKKATLWSEFVHNLRAAVIDATGTPVMEETTNDDGTSSSRYKTNWVGTPICLGRFPVLMEDGMDPEYCPACESAKSGGVKPPEVRYATNIIKYATRPNSFEPFDPFSAQVLAWTLTSKRYGKLVDMQEDAGPLLGYDLLLGPAEKPIKFQKYDIAKASAVAWRVLSKKDPAIAEYIKKLWNTPGNRATDAQLQALCGRLVTNRQLLLQDVRKCEVSWAKALGTDASATTGAEFSGNGHAPGVAEGLDDLLSDVTGDPAPAAPDASAGQLAGVQAAKAQAQSEVADILSPDPLAGLEEETPAPAAAAPAQAASTAPQTGTPTASDPQPEATSWDELLSGLE